MPEELIRIQKVAIKQGLIREFIERTHTFGLAVYLVICAHSKNNKTSQVGAQILINQTGLSRGTVFKCIERLENAGFIKRLQKKKGHVQIYRLMGVE